MTTPRAPGLRPADPPWVWWAVLVALAVCVGAALAFAAPEGFEVTCPLTAIEQEAQEGYFNCGRELAIVTKPGGPIHDDLTRMLGREVVVIVETK